MTEEAEEKTAYADTAAVGLIWNRDTGIECYEEEYLLKEWFKLPGWLKILSLRLLKGSDL